MVKITSTSFWSSLVAMDISDYKLNWKLWYDKYLNWPEVVFKHNCEHGISERRHRELTANNVITPWRHCSNIWWVYRNSYSIQCWGWFSLLLFFRLMCFYVRLVWGSSYGVWSLRIIWLDQEVTTSSLQVLLHSLIFEGFRQKMSERALMQDPGFDVSTSSLTPGCWWGRCPGLCTLFGLLLLSIW